MRIHDVPDYPNALNGVQIDHRGPVHGVAVAVDASLRSIDGAIAAGANLLVVHHGLFWSGVQRIEGRYYERLRRLIENDLAIYSAHLPLDAHETHGNSRLLAEQLGLKATAGFGRHEHVYCGVRGEADVRTAALHERLGAFSRLHGGAAIATPFGDKRRTAQWAICSGSGASRETLDEAAETGVDTLIVGEGPHWTAVDAEEMGIVVMYGGHYATETLGVCAVATLLQEHFGLPWTFIAAPTGL